LKKVLLLLLVISTSIYAATDVSGSISLNTTWTTAGDGIYRIVGDITIDPGVTLTIQPGVTVLFTNTGPDTFRILVNGTLNAIGTVTDSIIFRHEITGEKHYGIDFNSPSSGTLEYCRIQDGMTDGSHPYPFDTHGGGICIYNADPTIRHCTIQNNSAPYGAGIFVEDASAPLIESNIIRNNEAGVLGGGIGCLGNTNPTIRNNIIYNNSSQNRGGGISINNFSTVHLANNTVNNNSAVNGGGGLVIVSQGNTITVVNSIFWNNNSTSGPDEFDTGSYTDSMTVEYSDIQGGYAGTGNINSNPLFNNAANGDFHVEATSPIVDAGTSTGAPTTDFEGNARPYDGDRVDGPEFDMGAYEYINTPPVITSSPVLSVNEDNPYTYQVIAVDTDAGEDLLYEITTDATFLDIDAGTGEITGTPGNDDVDTYSVTVRVTDLNGAYDTQTYSLEVIAVNDPPVISDITNRVIAEGGSFASINLDDYVEDVDNPDATLTWTASATTNITVTITDRVATITVNNPEWNGSETVTFTVEDPGELTDSDDVMFTVTAVNDPPVVTDIPDQSIAEGASFTSINLDDYVSDADNLDTEISWTASTTTNITVTITDRVATITVNDPEWNGSETVTFTVEDPGELTDSDDVMFTVTAVNDPPVVTDIPNQTIPEDGSFTEITLDNYVSDPDNVDAEISWTASATTNITVTITDRVATITVNDPEWNDSETVTFTAEDPAGLTDSDDATFTVSALNDPPVVADIPDQSIAEGGSFATISLDDYVSDADNTDAQISWTSSVTTNVTVTITDRVATITINDPEWNGSESVTFTAEDPNGLTDSDDASFTVTPVNDPPVVADIPDQSIPEGDSFATITLDNYVSDPDNTDAEISWTASTTTDITVTIANRIATITVNDPEWGGSELVTFTAEDPAGLTDNDDATFTVSAVNDPPQIAPLPELVFNEDDSLVTAIDTLYKYVEDPDHPDSLLIITVKAGQHVIAYADSPNVVMKAPANWYGTDTLEVKVSDGELADSVKVVVLVKSINDVPYFTDLPDTVKFNNDSDTTLTMSQYAMDVDPNDNLSWSFEASATELNINFNDGSTELTLSAPGYVGVVTLRCTVTDDSSASVTDSFYVLVEEATAIEDMAGVIPLEYKLDQNYPNPFNPSTHIQFGMKKAGEVKIEVYNILGQKVMTLFDGYKDAGYHIIKFDAGGLSSGLYFYRMETKAYHSIRKMILMK
jgi:hypothetical protein